MSASNYRHELAERSRWRSALHWIHQHEATHASTRAENALAALNDPSAQGRLGWVIDPSQQRIVAAAYAALLPGRVLSIGGLRVAVPEAIAESKKLLQSILLEFQADEVELVQAISEEFEGNERLAMLGVGLRYLATLDHLVLFIDERLQLNPKVLESLNGGGERLRLVEYQHGQEDVLEEVISLSYHETLDCPALGNCRTGRGAVEGYLQSREQRHSWWFAQKDGKPIGCLLLWEKVPGIWEITYMGLIPSARGKRIGSVLLEAAIALAAKFDAKQLVLSVDRENLPAVHTYLQRGFYCYNSTEVWFCSGDEWKK